MISGMDCRIFKTRNCKHILKNSLENEACISWLHSRSTSKRGSVYDVGGGTEQPRNETQLNKSRLCGVLESTTCVWGAITF